MWKFIWRFKLIIVLLAALLWLVGSILISGPSYICSQCGHASDAKMFDQWQGTMLLHCPRCGETEIRPEWQYTPQTGPPEFPNQ